MTPKSTDVDVKLQEPDTIVRVKSIENSQSSSTESTGQPRGLASEKLDAESLARIESVTSAIYDPAARIPTNASRESGIIGTDPPPSFSRQSFCGFG